MSRQVVAVDIDDVLFPLIPELALLFNAIKRTKLAVEDFHTYHLAEVWGGTEDETTEVVNELLGRDLLHIPPIDGSKEALRRLASEYELHIVSSRPKRFERNTKGWLDYHFAGLFRRLDMVGSAYDGSQTHTKAEVCQGLGSQYLIDDQPKYVSECSDAGLSCVLFGEYAWNSGHQMRQNTVRCKNWDSVLEYFDGAN